MQNNNKHDHMKQVTLGAREYSISNVLFRNIVAERLGVNVTDMECLGLLFHKGIATPSELSQYTGLSSGSTTAMLDRLEKSKLIERRPNPNDRRGTLITIVKKTAEKNAPLFLSARKAQNSLVENYTEKELDLLLDFFKKSVSLWDDERKKLQENMKK